MNATTTVPTLGEAHEAAHEATRLQAEGKFLEVQAWELQAILDRFRGLMHEVSEHALQPERHGKTMLDVQDLMKDAMRNIRREAQAYVLASAEKAQEALALLDAHDAAKPAA